MMKFLQSTYAKLFMFMLVVGAAVTLGGVCRAEDFDASSTQTILTNALAVPKATLAWGIPIILTIVLGVWAIFWLIGKLRKHVK